LRKQIRFSSITGTGTGTGTSTGTGNRIEMYGFRVKNQRFLPFIKVFNPFAVRGKVFV
jgi:hypothetical protein